MTTHAALKLPSRAELTTQIKHLVGERQGFKQTLSKIEARLFALTYRWVELAIQEEAATSQADGIHRLAATLRRTDTSISSWYYGGRLMDAHKINPERANASAVRELSFRSGDLAKSEFLRCVDIIKKGTPDASKLVRGIVRKSSRHANESAGRRARVLMLRGELTATRAKMELMAVKTFFSTYFKKDVIVTVFDEDGESVLLETV